MATYDLLGHTFELKRPTIADRLARLTLERKLQQHDVSLEARVQYAALMSVLVCVGDRPAWYCSAQDDDEVVHRACLAWLALDASHYEAFNEAFVRATQTHPDEGLEVGGFLANDG